MNLVYCVRKGEKEWVRFPTPWSEISVVVRSGTSHEGLMTTTRDFHDKVEIQVHMEYESRVDIHCEF